MGKRRGEEYDAKNAVRSLLPVDLLRRRCSGGGILATGIYPLHGQQRQPQVTYPGQHAMQRGLVDYLSRKDGIAVLHVGDREPAKPIRPVLVQVPFHPNLVGGHPSSSPGLARYFVCPHSTRPDARCCRVYRVSGSSVRPASTTSSIVALVTRESALSYNSDSCVAPPTTRWMLLGESAASSSCIASQSDDCSPALITASGLSPRLWVLRTWALVSGVAPNSSTVVTTCCVEELNAAICARWSGGKSGCAG